MIIRAEDSVIVCARNEEDISQLEVYSEHSFIFDAHAMLLNLGTCVG